MKIGIITITNGENFGNRLQNYALQKYLEKMDIKSETFLNNTGYNSIIIYHIKKILKFTKHTLLYILKGNQESLRILKFMNFNKKINYSRYILNNDKYSESVEKKYDYFIAGSDQIWNLNYPENNIIYFLGFIKNNYKKISYAASFGASNIPISIDQRIPKWISEIQFISVREESGKEIVKKISNRDDSVVLLDPTMLLDKNTWNNIEKKPKKFREKKYILTYFLGNQSDNRKKEIKRIAKENDCSIIDLMDPSDQYYAIDPSEFLYLEKNAFLICTDSFHSCVFGLIYNVPFIVFEREQSDIVNMNSRIETLINKFQLENRKYNNKSITKENLNHDYSKAYKILEIERKKSEKFIKKAVNYK